MSYTLYGSQTSPFVRRIRIMLEKLPYEFKEMAIFEKEDAAKLNKINPLNKVPVFTDGELTLWDSRQIFNYLNSLHRFQNFKWEDENLLTAIDGAMESAMHLLILERSKVDIKSDIMFVIRQRERIDSVLKYLDVFMKDEGLKTWNFHTVSLYCFLDWANYRGIVKLSDHPTCQNFVNAHKERESVKNSAIPLGK